jgi:hypothetical protein
VKKYLALILILLAIVACTSAEPDVVSEVTEPAPTNTPIPATDIPAPTATETAVPPTDTPAPTNTPEPTATSSPTPTPTATPPDPIVISTDETAADGCPLIELNPESWQPLFAAYHGGGDPYFQFHTQAEESFHFNLEMYTVYGAGWTGQLGSFVPDCSGSNGLCVYIVPDNTNPYWATAGEISINALEQVDGALTFPVDITLSNLTMNPVPGSGSPGCFHIDELAVKIEK